MAETTKTATCADCNAIAPGAFTGNLDRCPTKAEIVASDVLRISGNYADNQLVMLSDISLNIKLVLSPANYTAPISGGSFTLNITCNTAWRVTYPGWCSGTTSGTGNASIRVTVASNANNLSRNGAITVTTAASGNNITKTCSVSQNGLPTIRLNVWGLTFSNTCEIRASQAILDDMSVHIEIETSDSGDSTGTAFFEKGESKASASIWPPIFNEENIIRCSVKGINYNGKMYDTSPVTTANAIYTW